MAGGETRVAVITSLSKTQTSFSTQEEDLHEAFSEYGEIKNIYMNLDRQTGFVKGYALIEYGKKSEAQGAIDNLNGTQILEKAIGVSWAFNKGDVRSVSFAMHGLFRLPSVPG
jgi:RNA recognition motif-containing protein